MPGERRKRLVVKVGRRQVVWEMPGVPLRTRWSKEIRR